MTDEREAPDAGNDGGEAKTAGDAHFHPQYSTGASQAQGPDPGLLARFFATPDNGQHLPKPASLGSPDGYMPPLDLAVGLLQNGVTPQKILELLPQVAIRLLLEDPDAPLAQEPKHPTDLGNARRLVAQHGQDLLFCDPLGGWLVWDGQRWAADETGQVERFAKATVANIYNEAANEPDPDRRKTLGKWAAGSESAVRIRAMIDLARSEPGVWVRPGEFDGDPWLLTAANGTLDLRTGELRPHDRADLITKLAPVAYDPAATDRTFTKYLDDATGGNADFAEYLQRAAGYTLTGSTAEESFFLVLGPAATGKSTLVEAMLAMLGDYALKSSFGAFLETRNVGGPTPEIARLRGARLVAAVETSKASHLNEVLVKELTGGDSVTARHLHHEPITFKPAFKLWLAANESPRLTDTDTGIWRRLQRLPFEHVIAEGDQDPQVKARLCSEAGPALLAWAVRGCLTWQRDGLRPCATVRAKTSELRAEFDPLAEFFGEQCLIDKRAQVAARDLRQAYEAWAASMGAKPINDREWARRLKALGCQARRERRPGGQMTIWHNIGLLGDDPDDPE